MLSLLLLQCPHVGVEAGAGEGVAQDPLLVVARGQAELAARPLAAQPQPVEHAGRVCQRLAPAELRGGGVEDEGDAEAAGQGDPREVAEAAGSFLGLTSGISAREDAVLQELERVVS